ncbi:TetR/AcrR family transcriptional regulator [Patulibacter defluvii]|uniref:TetR/AcrR family transcriptional regulator n=1 Tax=Patulibacter defluvii TaxID=3095358 RepID=UPI002A7513F9|nr:TetR/AcrR family transcriptional regulator [Patulibacter sp. DM4]
MPRTTPRKRPSQERSRLTVEAILDAAAQVFEAHGYAAGTTNRIAERAGVSIGSLYQYFPNKDAVLVALTERHVAEGAALVAPLLARLGPATPLEPALRELVGAMVAAHRTRPALHRVLVEECPRPPELRERLEAAFEGAARTVAAYLDASPEVDVPDPLVAARLVVQVVESVTHGLVIHPAAGDDVDRYVEETVRMLRSYLGAAA